MRSNVATLTTGAMLVGLSALGYSFNPIFAKFAYSFGANAISLGCIRFTFAAAGLWLMVLARKEGREVPVAQRLRLLALGAMGIAMVALLYFTALEHIQASLATGLFYTYPAMTAVIAVLRGEGPGKAGVAGLALTAAGTWMLLGKDLGNGGFTWQGALLILGGAVVYTGYMLLGNVWARGVSPTVSSAYMTTGSAAVYMVLALVTRPVMPGGGAYVWGAGMALVTTIFALITFWAGVPRVGTTRAAIISNLEPVFTAMLAVLLLGERLTLPQTLGIALVILGAVAAQLKEQPEPTQA